MKAIKYYLSQSIPAMPSLLLGGLYLLLRGKTLAYIKSIDITQPLLDWIVLAQLFLILSLMHLLLNASCKFTRFRYTKDKEKGYYIHKRTQVKVCPKCLQQPECFENQLSNAPNGLKCDSCNWEVDTRKWTHYPLQPTVMSTDETPPELAETNKEVENENLDDNDIISILESWMGHRDARLNTKVIRYCEVDKELNLPTGSTAKHIEKAAQRLDYVVVRKGDTTILFKENPNKSNMGSSESWWDKEF